MKTPVPSAEVFVIPVESGHLVYAPLRQAAFVASAELVNAIADIREGTADLTKPGMTDSVEFLRQMEIVDAGEEKRPITGFSGVPKPTSVTLFLTTACNLRCTYCYAAAGDTPTRVMPMDVAQRGVDFIVANALELARPEIEIYYHGGGEPTVNWRTLTGIYEYAAGQAARAGLTLKAALATNGVLAEEKISWIISHLDGVSLSFDGLPEVHDACRVGLDGVGSSSAVVQTIRRFDAAGFPYGLRLTVTKEHISQMEASIRYLCENFRPQRIQVEPAYQLGRWKDAPSAETADFIVGFRAAQSAAREHGMEIHFSAARSGMLTNHFCGITQDSFCLTADGSVSACYETFLEQNEWAKTFFYGAFDSETQSYRFDMPVLDHLRRQSVEHRGFCAGCFAKWSCGGDCYHKSLAVNGPGEFQGSDRCHIIREITKDQILEKIAAAGGLFYHQERLDVPPGRALETAP